jgi:mannose/fructose/N-acetylgalactosamine-specific phosphotransferase system component IIC
MRKIFLILTALTLPLFSIGWNLADINIENAVAVEESDSAATNNKLVIEDDGRTHVGVSPYDIHLDLTPGSSYDETFKILNYGAETMEYNIKVSPYAVSGEDYNPNFETENNYTQISKWIMLDKNSGTLESGGIEEITYHINVPTDVAPGGQYATITVFATSQQDENNDGGFQIAVNVGVAYVIYGNVVGGETRAVATVSENSISPLLLDGNISAKSLIENTGNTHITAKYILQVFPAFSDEEVYTNEEEPIERTVLPRTSRVADTAWNGTPAYGIFRVIHTITIGDESYQQESYVVKCPVWLMITILIVIFFTLMTIVAFIVKKVKKSKKVKQSQKANTETGTEVSR